MRVGEIRLIPSHEWASILGELRFFSPFWRPEWYRLFHGRWALSSNISGSLRVPVLVKDKVFFNTVHSGPFGTYGGPVSEPGEFKLDELCSYLQMLAVKLKAIKLVFHGSPQHRFTGNCPPGVRVKWDETMMLAPVPSDPLGRCKSSCKRNYRKAVREGVTLRVSDSLADVEVYYRMYLDTVQRQRGRLRFDLTFFRRLRTFPGAVLLMACRKAEPLAGVWLLWGKGEVFYWHGASFTKWLHLRPNNFLHVEAIRMAYERGMQFYNMGANIGNPGLRRFKASFGAEPVRYPIVTTSILSVLATFR